MFFSGSSSTRKKVDLGGRSSKERDRQVLLEQTRLERKKRLGMRQHNSAAIKIQKCFRGRKSVAQERSKIREQFINTYGDCSVNMDLIKDIRQSVLGMTSRNYFSPGSAFLRQLLFFFKANNHKDFVILVETCQKLLQFFRDSGTGGLMSIMAAEDYNTNHTVVDYRLKKFSYFCIQAVHQNREQLLGQLLLSEEFVSMPTVILLESVVYLANHEFPWGYKIVDNLAKRKVYSMLRDIILTGRDYRKTLDTSQSITSVERIIIAIVSYTSEESRFLTFDPQWSFSSQILSIPFLWHHFPYLKEAITSTELGKCYITQMVACLRNQSNVLPGDTSHGFPGFACLVGNLLEIVGVVLSQPFVDCSMTVDFATVASRLLEMFPPLQILDNKDPTWDNIIPVIDENNALVHSKLRKQISDAVDPLLLENLVNALFKDTMPNIQSLDGKVSVRESIMVGAICSFLHATFNILPLERIMTVLAYRTDIVLILWNFIKRCHGNQQWSYFSKLSAHLLGDAPGWLLPLSVFCPVYKHMLMIIDNEEFYEQEKPLPLKDIRSLILILRQVLWELLWLIPGNSLASQKGPIADTNKITVENLKYKVKLDTSELLSQLQDWNNRQPFTSFSDFHALDAVGESFVSQALSENKKAKELLKLAPFLVPFTSRVKIFTSQLRAARQRDGHHPAFSRLRFKIRRNKIFEDAFNQLHDLSEEELKGMLRVSFINEVGAEEAGIDGGGIFKDFMENITRAAFDVQYGLFKESTDHLLYPNPGSGLIHEQHLQFFHFLGTILGKAMFEGILVDIPFAMFFLSKLKQKYNYLNDLPSLDPELYRHLLFLKNYVGDVADLELYFVIVNNDYGVQTEEDLISNGRNTRVTKENVIQFIHLIANYRLNSQIRHQSSCFLRGFQQLIDKDWIDMFNEHEIQIQDMKEPRLRYEMFWMPRWQQLILLISGSLDGMDVDDLRVNAHYSGGYHPDHQVIQMFWDILKNFPSVNQKKFLKFVTGCSRGPLLGFKYLEPGFCIQRAGPSDASEEELDRLPTSATCMNLLKLPPYKSKVQLETKLLYAISADAGFDLS